jgi:hypothetical protein
MSSRDQTLAPHRHTQTCELNFSVVNERGLCYFLFMCVDFAGLFFHRSLTFTFLFVVVVVVMFPPLKKGSIFVFLEPGVPHC